MYYLPLYSLLPPIHYDVDAKLTGNYTRFHDMLIDIADKQPSDQGKGSNPSHGGYISQ
jgi:hypothetical protein